MPLLVQTEDAQAGMRLAEPFVYHGLTMLPKGKVLTASDVSSLKRRFRYGYHIRVIDPFLDDHVEFEDDALEREIASNVQRKIAKCTSEVEHQVLSRTTPFELNLDPAHEVVEDLVDYITDNPVSTALLNRCLEGNGYLAMHTGNVFYLSIVMARALNSYVIEERKRQSHARDLDIDIATDLFSLGLGALFMDLGMYSLKYLFKENRKLTSEERELLRQHPIAGVELLPRECPPAAKMVVRTHHENFDGSGYPDRLAGNTLHVFSRIVRIADAYDAATSTLAYKDAKSPAYALWGMTSGHYKRFYDPAIMKVFAGLIQPFPIGASLQLTDGRSAVVVKYNRANPFQPYVAVCFDPVGQRLPKSEAAKPIALDESSGLRIKSFQGEDLSYIYHDDGRGWSQRQYYSNSDQYEFNNMFEMAFP